MEIVELTRKLIDIPSVSGEERAVGEFLAEYLRSLSYRVERQEAATNRFNIIATKGARPRAVLSTHIDTVPPHIASSEDDEYIYGRGACDTKGIIAAQIAAAERLQAEGIGDIGLLFLVDEEVGGLGARTANEHPLAASCEYMINGEPTDNKLALGSKGSWRVALTTKGRAAHSAYPEQGDSAIEKLLDVLERVRKIAWPKDAFFGDTTCNIGTISGGTRTNVVPAEARAELHLRLVTDVEPIKALLEDAVAGQASIEYMSLSLPVRMLEVDGFESCIVRFTTDIPYLTKWGQPLLLGPGSILDAHTPTERISKREQADAVELYIRLVRTLLKR